MADVFISYAREDREFVLSVCEALEKHDREAWFDREIQPALPFMDEVAREIESADAFLFVISPQAVESEYCRQEIEHAVANGKRLIPILRHDVLSDRVHPNVACAQFINLGESDDFAAGIEQLVTALGTDLEWRKTHTRLLLRALDWERGSRSNNRLLRGEDLRSVSRSRDQVSDDILPRITPLQEQYIAKSWEYHRQRRRRRCIVATVVLFAVVVLLISVVHYRARSIVGRIVDPQLETQRVSDELGSWIPGVDVVVAPRLRTTLLDAVALGQESCEPDSEHRLNDTRRVRQGRHAARAAMALFHLGKWRDALDVFRVGKDPEPLTQFIVQCRVERVTQEQLRRPLFEILERRKRGHYSSVYGEHETTVCYGLLLSFGQYQQLSEKEREQVICAYRQDPSSAVHSACRWILMQAGEDVRRIDACIAADHAQWMGDATWVQKRLRLQSDSPPDKFEWFTIEVPPEVLNDRYVTMIVLPSTSGFLMGYPGPAEHSAGEDYFPKRFLHLERLHEVNVPLPFALSSIELPLVESRGASPIAEGGASLPQDPRHANALTKDRAVELCDMTTRALSFLFGAGLPSARDEQGGLDRVPEGGGFRLPRDYEWEYACKAGTCVHFSFGSSQEPLGWFAQFKRPGGSGVLIPLILGRKLPNMRGFFDMHGGRYELCSDPAGTAWAWRGGSVEAVAENCRSTSTMHYRNDSSANAFRLCLPL